MRDVRMCAAAAMSTKTPDVAGWPSGSASTRAMIYESLSSRVFGGFQSQNPVDVLVPPMLTGRGTVHPLRSPALHEDRPQDYKRCRSLWTCRDVRCSGLEPRRTQHAG